MNLDKLSMSLQLLGFVREECNTLGIDRNTPGIDLMFMLPEAPAHHRVFALSRGCVIAQRPYREFRDLDDLLEYVSEWLND